MITTDLKLAGMVITWCALHSGMISTTVTRYLKHNLGAGFRYYRLYFNFVSTVTLIPIYHYGFVVHDSVLFNWRGPTMVIQVPLAAAGVLLLLAGARHYDMMQIIGFRQISSTTSPGALTQSGWLETSGILSKIRHPWYLAAILLVWARGFNCPATTRRAQKFPRFTSFRVEISKDRSATSFFSLAFSFSSSLSRLACWTSKPPYSLRHR